MLYITASAQRRGMEEGMRKNSMQFYLNQHGVWSYGGQRQPNGSEGEGTLENEAQNIRERVSRENREEKEKLVTHFCRLISVLF